MAATLKRIGLVISVFGLWSLSTVALAQSAALVIVGLGGNESYNKQFIEQGEVVAEGLRSISEADSDVLLLTSEEATREAILAQLEQTSALPLEQFVLVLIGHGSANATGWRFNIAGPDITATDLLESLNTLAAKEQVVIAASSASGALLNLLSQPGRTVVTATKSAGEINAVRFPEFFAEAMQSTVADADKNEILTLSEVWRYANQQTQDYYRDHNLLASEHARLNGNQASKLVLAKLGALKHAKNNSEVAALLDQRLQLESQFTDLRDKKAQMGVAEYYDELETVLLSIAKLQQEIDKATGWEEDDEQ